MSQTGTQSEHHGPEMAGLSALGLSATGRVFWNLGTAALCERAVARGEARLTDTGALVVTTAQGAAPGRYLVREAGEDGAGQTGAGGDIALLPRQTFETLKADLLAHAGSRTLFGQEAQADAGPGRRVALRVLSEQAWHALLARNLLPAPDAAADTGAAGADNGPHLTILCAPSFRPDAERHGLGPAGAIAIDLDNGLALVAGTARSEAIREALFIFLADRLAGRGVLALRGAVTHGPAGDVALFLGTSGAGKTALAGYCAQAPVGDGALAWQSEGVFVLETGAYARPADRLHPPEAAPGFGAVLENIAVDPDTRVPDFADAASAALARAIAPAGPDRRGGSLGAPTHLFMLVQDRLGVLPPIARLSPEQALYHFLSGYGAGGTGETPEAAFAPGFAAAELPGTTDIQGRLLRDLLAAHAPTCWLVNTGWVGGQAGSGRRVPLETSRRLVDAALAGELAAGEWRTDAHFGFAVPTALEDVDPRLLDPARAWPSQIEHGVAARRLAGLFGAHFARFETAFGEGVRGAQPGMAMAAE
ncbi:phosphoenolpyruvate carboxykinase (ATP) [Ancylobacter dichloromethanicus]|uniref:phosphoenolpyruvate carboxykinase (ATP) n=1 Tax=Ancylobacter dichloromethanicus TaxID=518825 RepID=A0A9W6N1L0_9HYPH|nr:phosphoenolpyruvate carboxykinase (ATP) [Ancylobacter dichloromethanicus]MBS7553385.1 phosphoenolpyruvate carboxykinase (ATP) [Ancylobacter dichloromethanicus]GLK74306.1 phosphoenolpyruvate carboxykinase [ATP] [Ancylobacter dichloromethanicus]